MFPLRNTGHEPLCKNYFFRFLTAEEVLAHIEENEAVSSGMAFIQPPSDGFDDDGNSGDEGTGGSMNNLSEKQLQAIVEARVVSVSRFQESNEENNRIGCLPDSVDSSQLFLNMKISFGAGLRHKEKKNDG